MLLDEIASQFSPHSTQLETAHQAIQADDWTERALPLLHAEVEERPEVATGEYPHRSDLIELR